MTDVLDLDAFVSKLAEDGTHHSEGQFTLSEEKAKKKLSDFTLVDPLAWVSKLLQAASRWNVISLEVTQTRLFTSFVFCPADLRDIPKEEEVLEVFESGHIDTGSPLFLFCLALRTLVGRAEMSFICNARSQSQKFTQPLASGQDAINMGLWRREAWSTLASDGIILSVSHVKKGRSLTSRYLPGLLGTRVQFHSEVAKLLNQSALFTPFPIYLDKRCLSDPANVPKFGYSNTEQPLVYTGLEIEDMPNLQVGDHLEEKLMSVFTTPQRCRRAYSRKRDFSAWLLLRLRTCAQKVQKEPSATLQITWLRYGVEARTRYHRLDNLFLNLHLFLNGDLLETDISGMSLIESEELFSLEKRALEVCCKKLEELSARARDLVRDDLDRSSRLDRHSQIPSFDGKDIDKVRLLDFFSAPATEVVFNGLPFLFSSMGYHMRETKVRFDDFLSGKEAHRASWYQALDSDFELLLASFESLAKKA